jgi:hypothetical protein
MGRMIIGAVVAAVAMFFIGFIFFGPLGLNHIATGSLPDAQAAAIQQSLSANLPNPGTFVVPSPESSPAQTVMYGQGPIATIHYNTAGFAAMDTKALGIGFLFDFLIALLIGAALLGIEGRVPDLGSKARVAMIIAVAGAAFTHLSEPIYYHHDWPHFVYAFVADGLMLAAAGLILAWFLTRRSRTMVAATEPIVEPEPEPPLESEQV